jgi:VanZ family protein
MVIVYDFSEQRVYINSEQKEQTNFLKGNFSNWDSSFKLSIGNEITGNRPWKGKIYYVAIFDRPLTEKEIRKNYLSGLHSTELNEFEEKGPVTRYLFDEGKSDVIHDSGSVTKPVNLFMPKYITPKKEPFLGLSVEYLKNKLQISDIIINILIFIPLGILLHGMLRTRFGLTLKISLAALVAGTLFSLGVESIQYFSITRNSSFVDVITNMMGVATGTVLYRVYNLFLKHQAQRLQMLI